MVSYIVILIGPRALWILKQRRPLYFSVVPLRVVRPRPNVSACSGEGVEARSEVNSVWLPFRRLKGQKVPVVGDLREVTTWGLISRKSKPKRSWSHIKLKMNHLLTELSRVQLT